MISEFRGAYVVADGVEQLVGLERLASVALEEALPVRSFPSYHRAAELSRLVLVGHDGAPGGVRVVGRT
ncbi:hypothetical protein [Nonomuraea sp. NPDC049028]|uniref:hypothetical protein n=1 Tax=Nonomuraea sp. NPDC049028 TaxID=3364348 RepID=UPI003711FFCC